MPSCFDVSDSLRQSLLDNLYSHGWCILAGLLPDMLCRALAQEIVDYHSQELQAAGIGRAADHQLDGQIRLDKIHWLDGGSQAQRDFLAWMEGLRREINRQLFLGLWDYECHFARYLPGAFYAKHVDAFSGQRNRVLSTVLYLNPDWSLADGGELVLYRSDDPAVELVRCIPQWGTLAVFLSENFPHEVLPANRIRHSIAGWFRVNGTQGTRLDPAR